jgi:hypothetical protein
MCGLENSNTDRYCYNCYADLKQTNVQSTQQQQQQQQPQQPQPSYLDQYYPQNTNTNYSTQNSNGQYNFSGQSVQSTPQGTATSGQASAYQNTPKSSSISIPVQNQDQSQVQTSFDGTPQFNASNDNFYILQQQQKGRKKIILGVVFVVAIIIIAAIALSLSGSPDGKNEIIVDNDNDGVADEKDAFPYDPAETKDSDADGVGDNADKYPMDPTETMDSDGDGNGDNADLDDDNDGYLDTEDEFPTNRFEWVDWDDDDMGDNSDPYLVKTLTQADQESEDTNLHPRFKGDQLYYITYNWWLMANPPYINSQDIYRYNIDTGDKMSVYHDDKKIKNPYGVPEAQPIYEIAVSPARIYFNQDTVTNENGTVYHGFSRELNKYENNQVTTVKGTGVNEFCEDLSTFNNKVVYVFKKLSDKYVYQDVVPNKIDGPGAFDPDIDSSGIVYVLKIPQGSVVRKFDDDMITNITDLEPDIEFRRPKISGAYIVYERLENENSDIYLYNMLEDDHSQLTDTAQDDLILDFDGKYVLFRRSSTNKTIKGVYVVEVASGKVDKIADIAANNGEINGNYFALGYDQNIYLGQIKKPKT